MTAKESAGCCASVVDQDHLSLERLIEQSKAGSREAFGSLVERYEKRVFHFLCRLAGNSHDAEDLTQDTFLKVYQNLNRFNSAQGFSTWLFTIAKRTAFNHFRGAKRFQELSGPEEMDFEDPSILLQQKDEKASLWKLAEALPPAQSEALWLRYGEGFSISEVARILNTSQIRVRVLLHRARKHLAERLRSADIQIS